MVWLIALRETGFTVKVNVVVLSQPLTFMLWCTNVRTPAVVKVVSKPKLV